MRLEPLEYGPVRDVIHELRLALEILQILAFAVLGRERGHESRGVAVSAEMPIVIGKGVAEGPAIRLRDGGAQRLDRRQGWGSHLHRKALREFGEVLLRRPVIVRSAALQIHRIRAPGVVASAVERGGEIGQALVEDGLGNTFIASEPHGDRRMIPVAADHIPRVGQEQRRILRLDLKVLGRHPEVIEHQQAILVGEVIENVLGILPEPVANDVEMGLPVQPKIGLQPLARNPLARVVHSPAAPARRDGYAIDPNREIGSQ